MSKLRILIVDDHTILRQSLATALNAQADMQAIHCGSVGEALLIVGSGLADLVLLDVDLGAERGTDFLELARRNGFQGPVIVLTAGISEADERLLRQRGISGVLLKDASIERLAEEIRDALGSVLAPVSAAPQKPSDQPRPFSARESQVLRLLVRGMANKEIAHALDSSEPMVRNVVQRLFRKTGTHSRSQLVFVALENLRGEL